MPWGKPSKPHVAIIGGGFAGRRARNILSKRCVVTLIDSKPFFEYTPANLRCIVDPKHAAETTCLHPEGTIVDTATCIFGNGNVQVQQGSIVESDYVIDATGSEYPGFIKAKSAQFQSMSRRFAEFEGAYKEISLSSSIAVVGGGTVGVELAAEICGEFKTEKATQRRVTVITSGDRLLPRLSPKASAHAKRWLDRKKAHVLTHAKVKSASEKGVVRLENGRSMHFSKVIECTGGESNRNTLTLCSRAEDRVFQCGDAGGHSSEKNALNADLNAHVAAENLLLAAEGGGKTNDRRAEARPLRWPESVAYGAKEMPLVSCVSLHRHDGIFQVGPLCVCGWLAAAVKYAIEKFQMAVARERKMAHLVWLSLEKATVFLAVSMQRMRSLWRRSPVTPGWPLVPA